MSPETTYTTPEEIEALGLHTGLVTRVAIQGALARVTLVTGDVLAVEPDDAASLPKRVCRAMSDLARAREASLQRAVAWMHGGELSPPFRELISNGGVAVSVTDARCLLVLDAAGVDVELKDKPEDHGEGLVRWMIADSAGLRPLFALALVEGTAQITRERGAIHVRVTDRSVRESG